MGKSKLNIQAKLQTFSGAMMVPIILLVLVGFYVGIGAGLTNYVLPEGSIFATLINMLVSLGFMFMNNLQLWFAVAIAFTLAKKEKGWAAFAGVVMYMSLIAGIQSYAGAMGFNADSTTVEALVATGNYTEEAAMNFNALWGTSLGFFGYNMGIFSGIISGLVASWLHNRFVDTTFSAMFAFFQGTKFVIIMVTLVSIPLSVLTYYVWPYIGGALQSLTSIISSTGLFGTFLFGTADKMLLPFGIHHLIAFPIEYSAVGGTMEIDGVVYEGVRNIINGQAASADATGYITRNFTTGRVLFQLAGLPGAGLAFYKTARPENRKRLMSVLIPSILTLALVGISEPIEYTFLFVAPALYFLVYAPLCGLCYVVAEVFKISINGHALLFMIPNLFQPHKVHAMPLLFLLPLTFLVYYFVFRFIIVKFDLKTPGRAEEGDVKLMSKKEFKELKKGTAMGDLSGDSSATADDSLEARIIEALGGPDNIESVTACATRLRAQVKDGSLVAEDAEWQGYLEAIGVVRADENRSLQIIYGVRVGGILTKMKDILGLD
ncbi:MAG: PTS transporter subunit EIIC [Clostridiaceae bacterium]|nr:PTS transporter subunit EIIC [Clostridiaceae bacterium]